MAIGKSQSKSATLQYGIAQGSFLGPVLFSGGGKNPQLGSLQQSKEAEILGISLI